MRMQYPLFDPADPSDPLYQVCGGPELRFHCHHRPSGDLCGTLQIIFKVLLVEARTALLTGFTITTGLLLGYSAMSGTVGGGGLGDIAVRYGYYRWKTDIMIVTVVLLILIFQIIQNIGTKVSAHFDHRKR